MSFLLRSLVANSGVVRLTRANAFGRSWTSWQNNVIGSSHRCFASGKFFAKSHEYAILDQTDPSTAIVGVTAHAVHLLGEVVFVALPDVGSRMTKDEPFCQIESVKAVGDVYGPVNGEVVAVNEMLNDSANAINESPDVEGWLVKVKIDEGVKLGEGLMRSEEEYKEFCETEG